MAKATEAQKRASIKYDKENTVQKLVKLNKGTDKDILEMLTEVNNFQGYIKDLIRTDMKGERKYMKYRKTATRIKREEFDNWFNLRCKFAMDANFNQMYYFERGQLYERYKAEYIKQDTEAGQRAVIDECEKELIKLKQHWKDVEIDDIDEDEYYDDPDEGYTDGFDHLYDDELKVNNLY